MNKRQRKKHLRRCIGSSISKNLYQALIKFPRIDSNCEEMITACRIAVVEGFAKYGIPESHIFGRPPRVYAEIQPCTSSDRSERKAPIISFRIEPPKS